MASGIGRRRAAAKEDGAQAYQDRRREIAEAAVRVFSCAGLNAGITKMIIKTSCYDQLARFKVSAKIKHLGLSIRIAGGVSPPARRRTFETPVRVAAAHALYGPTFNSEVTLKALSYFDDGNLQELPDDLKLRMVKAAREVDLDRLPDLQQNDTDYGPEQ